MMNKNDKSIQRIDSDLRHIAFIMDGNGRWAKKRGMPRTYGHKEGVKTFELIADYCAKIGLEAVTVYAFSTENWKRPKEEVDALMKLVEQYLDEFAKKAETMSVELHMIGDMSVFPQSLQDKIQYVEKLSSGKPCKLCVAFNYGGRNEIVHACNTLIAHGKQQITEQDICNHLYTAGIPDPDLIVRTGGEMRLSNFLLWQAAYSEFYATEKLWPDMKPDDVDQAIEAFHKRSRRFGGV
jgi:undecaprenyl diphosphate synthase